MNHCPTRPRRMHDAVPAGLTQSTWDQGALDLWEGAGSLPRKEADGASRVLTVHMANAAGPPGRGRYTPTKSPWRETPAPKVLTPGPLLTAFPDRVYAEAWRPHPGAGRCKHRFPTSPTFRNWLLESASRLGLPDLTTRPAQPLWPDPGPNRSVTARNKELCLLSHSAGALHTALVVLSLALPAKH